MAAMTPGRTTEGIARVFDRPRAVVERSRAAHSRALFLLSSSQDHIEERHRKTLVHMGDALAEV